jgi:flavin reductase (DIM6/NTAB) family NADH-FMN oxidoreductase RutF
MHIQNVFRGGLLYCKLQLFNSSDVKRNVKHYSLEEIQGWSRFYRANFVNSLSGFKPVSLIGTTNESGEFNLAIFSNIVHLGADPTLIGFINRPREAAPHTLANIEQNLFYTINHISPEYIDKAHQTSAKYPEGVSEFEMVGLTPEIKIDFKAPFVKESLVQYAMELVEVVSIKHNHTFLVVGKMIHAFVEPSYVGEDGFIDLLKAQSVVSLGLDGYGKATALQRFSYAKPDQPLTELGF